MPTSPPTADPSRPAGYLLLQQRHGLTCLPHHVESFISHGTRRTHSTPEKTQETYPRNYWPGESDFEHLEFALKREGQHFIAPRPQDLAELMDDYLDASRRILHSNLHPVIAAAVVAYPFVFLHPFSDGNGRLHRFLIHYVLSFRRFAPDGVVFPISATMLHRPQDYDASLESFSKPLLPLIQYKLDFQGRMTVANDTRDFYRYVDCTTLTEN